MAQFQTVHVFPNIPKQLLFLEKLSRNLWWSWQRDAVELFRHIDPQLWRESNRNPIVLSTMVSPERLQELARDPSFLAIQQQVQARFESMIQAPMHPSFSVFGNRGTIAYFSMEFGIHENLPLFAGGLGILAGDHLKSASDMRIPLTGVGLYYRQGYFQQFLDYNGYQQEVYHRTDMYAIPLEQALDPEGKEVRISVTGPEGVIHAMVWKLNIGRISLYLLDTNIRNNPPEIRDITSSLYTGDPKKRLAQEILLGIGGMRALTALGIFPTICHLNEGHCAFASIERLALFMSGLKIDIKTALEIVPRTTVFTTHTPVAAGHEEFSPFQVKPYLLPFQETLQTSLDEMLSWGQTISATSDQPFSMFVLSQRMSQYCNGVSKLHGKVARRMWTHIWPRVFENEIPITHVTNGVHIRTWISHENALLFERYIGPDWHRDTQHADITKRFDQIHDEELWRAHDMNRSRLIRTCREMLIKKYLHRHAPADKIKDAESVLNQNVLTIAFARRFASYKRAYLILQEPERLEAILNSDTYPVQFIFSGKAHPRDTEGKDLIKRIIEFSRRPSVQHRIIFLEDYDMHIAHHLVQGADVWLNTPRRPFEACGTSGIKAAINGVLNLSILDGWWEEGYSNDCGWKIGDSTDFADPDYQDRMDSQSLYNVLENEVIPCFYDRSKSGVPVGWVRMMKASMKMAMHRFSSQRMVGDYQDRFYSPGAFRFRELSSNQAAEAAHLADQHQRLALHWNQIHLNPPIVVNPQKFYRVGDSFSVTIAVNLGVLGPSEVDVELCLGIQKHAESIEDIQTETMSVSHDRGYNHYQYACSTICKVSGQFAYTVRVTPRGDQWIKYTPGLITWASS
jgi:starch phosphorylase